MDDNKTKPNKEVISKKDFIRLLQQGFSLEELDKLYELPCHGDYLFKIMEEQGISDIDLALKAGCDSLHSVEDFRTKRGIISAKQLKSIASVLNLSDEDSQLLIEVCRSLNTKTIINLLENGYSTDELKIAFPSFLYLLDEIILGKENENGEREEGQNTEEKKVIMSDFADTIGINKATVSKYYSGTAAPSRDTLLTIAEKYELTFEKTQLLLKTANRAVLSYKRPGDLKYIEKFTKNSKRSNSDSLTHTEITDDIELKDKITPDHEVKTNHLGQHDQEESKEAYNKDILSSDYEKSEQIKKMLEDGKTIDEIETVIPKLSLGKYLNELIENKKINLYDAAIDINSTKQYIDKICNGTSAGSRNFILRFALSQHLSYGETQMLLKNGNFAQLSRDRKRDIIIIDGIINARSLDEVNEDLIAHKKPNLFSRG